MRSTKVPATSRIPFSECERETLSCLSPEAQNGPAALCQVEIVFGGSLRVQSGIHEQKGGDLDVPARYSSSRALPPLTNAPAYRLITASSDEMLLGLFVVVLLLVVWWWLVFCFLF